MSTQTETQPSPKKHRSPNANTAQAVNDDRQLTEAEIEREEAELDRYMEQAFKDGAFDEIIAEARADAKVGKSFPFPGDFEDGKWDDKIGEDAVAGVFDKMNAQELQAYFDDLRARSGNGKNCKGVANEASHKG